MTNDFDPSKSSVEPPSLTALLAELAPYEDSISEVLSPEVVEKLHETCAPFYTRFGRSITFIHVRDELEDLVNACSEYDGTGGAGNGSQGGALNIGAMSGLRGVEVFEVNVDRDSHLQSMTSFNATPGQYNALRDGGVNEFLEVVNLTSIGAEGDLEIGRTTANLDSRVALWGDQDANGIADADRAVLFDGLGNSGLLNVREFNTENFNGALNVAFTLDNNAIARYLDSAEDVVTFDYNGGNQNDIFNISDISTLGVSADQDFAMDVDMGAGDDRLVINMPTSRAVSVDGGEGENSIVVSQTHGTNAANTFAAFANFQTYEVEGTVATSHDFTSMSGVENVVIATGTSTPIAAGGNTTLIDLEAAQDVTVSGKNQTIGNRSTADQDFGTITLTDDAGVERTVTLDNTARLSNAATGTADQDGILTVTNLIMNTGTGTSATRDVIIDSAGERNVANAVLSFSGRDVETLQLTGTQELTFNVNQIADQATAAGVNASTALDIDASELEGDLNLAVNGAMIGNWGTATGLTDTIAGTDGDNDTLMVYGAQGNSPVTVTDFESVQFGSVNTTLFGDWATAALDATGIFDAQNVSANNFVIVDDATGNTALTLNNLSSGATVNMGDANTDVNGAAVNSQDFDDTITLDSGAVAGTPAASVNINYLSNIVGSETHTLNIGTVVAGVGNDTGGFQTVNIDIAHAANLTAANGNSIGVDARILNLTLTEDVRELNITGADNSGFTDTLNLAGVALPNNLTQIDLSGYEGAVTLNMESVLSSLTQTDVRFIMSEDNANITLSDFTGAIAGIQHNSIFEFTAANTTAAPSTWVIDNVIGAADTAALGTVGTIDNITRFDVSDLGITSFDQIVIDTNDASGTALAAGIFSIRSEAQDDASVLSGANQNTWEIQVTGLQALSAGDLTADNFIFA